MTAPLTLEQRVERIEAALGFETGLIEPRVPWPLRRSAILREAARQWGVGVDDLTGPAHIRQLVIPRAAAVMALRTEPPMSYSEIGRMLHRDHSSIMNLERLAECEFGRDAQFRARVIALHRVVEPKPQAVAS